MSEITACSQSAVAFTLCCLHHQQEEVPHEGCVCARRGDESTNSTISSRNQSERPPKLGSDGQMARCRPVVASRSSTAFILWAPGPH